MPDIMSERPNPGWFQRLMLYHRSLSGKAEQARKIINSKPIDQTSHETLQKKGLACAWPPTPISS